MATQHKDAQVYFGGISIVPSNPTYAGGSAIGNASLNLMSFTNGVALATTFDATETDPATISGALYTLWKKLQAQGLA